VFRVTHNTIIKSSKHRRLTAAEASAAQGNSSQLRVFG